MTAVLAKSLCTLLFVSIFRGWWRDVAALWRVVPWLGWRAVRVASRCGRRRVRVTGAASAVEGRLAGRLVTVAGVRRRLVTAALRVAHAVRRVAECGRLVCGRRVHGVRCRWWAVEGSRGCLVAVHLVGRWRRWHVLVAARWRRRLVRGHGFPVVYLVCATRLNASHVHRSGARRCSRCVGVHVGRLRRCDVASAAARCGADEATSADVPHNAIWEWLIFSLFLSLVVEGL